MTTKVIAGYIYLFRTRSNGIDVRWECYRRFFCFFKVGGYFTMIRYVTTIQRSDKRTSNNHVECVVGDLKLQKLEITKYVNKHFMEDEQLIF
jgi:hypothetical protein